MLTQAQLKQYATATGARFAEENGEIKHLFGIELSPYIWYWFANYSEKAEEGNYFTSHIYSQRTGKYSRDRHRRFMAEEKILAKIGASCPA